jgi:hypothetical protein
MPAAPHERPAVATVLRSYSAFISEDADAVFDALVRRVANVPSASSMVLVDKRARKVVLQGDWWYRGEWIVSLDPAGGSDVDYTIVNVAQRAHWAAKLTARRTLREAPDKFEKLAAELRDELE